MKAGLMKQSLRAAIVAATILSTAFTANESFARGKKHNVVIASEIEISGYLEGVTDYRWRGLSASDGDFAIQGGVSISHPTGFYASVWSSSIEDSDELGNAEVDFSGGWTGEIIPNLTTDVGLYYYSYPNGKVGPADILETYASASTNIGPLNAKVGVNYALKQASLGDEDSLYAFTEMSATIPNIPVSVNAHLGYTDGALSPNRLTETSDKGGFDYSLNASYNVMDNIYLTATYIGVDGASIDGYSNDTVVGSIKFTF